MKFKLALAASTALALVAAAPGAQAGDLYLSVFGGANFVTDTTVYESGEAEFFASDADTGFLLGGAIGTHLDKWANGLRTELEVSYRRNDVGGAFDATDDSTTGVLDGNLSTFAIMTNVWYDFDIGAKVKPYVGGGAGWARSHYDMASISDAGDVFGSTTTDISGFAWQLGAGFHYEVSPNVNVGLGYRYFSGPNPHDAFDDGDLGDLQNDNHSVSVDLTIGIN